MSPFKTKKFNVYHLLLLSGLVAFATFCITDVWQKNKNTEQASAGSNSQLCKLNVKRLSGLKYIKPIMFADDDCESVNLQAVKQRISEIINRYKTAEGITSTSVYLRDFDNNEWTLINENEKYKPGSLLKVAVLITILKMNEENPGFLNKEILYNQSFAIDKSVAYINKSITIGQKYTVKELLNYMIQYSDNNATALLESNMKISIFKDLFTDLGLETPNEYSKEYLMTVNQYSYFMRAIYNAAYLTIKESEYAAEFLTKCEFKDGIIKGLPQGTLVAHKFGESGDLSEKQLHESAIVYLDGTTYLLTIMTKGKDNQKLLKLIAEISQAVYLEMHNGEASVM